MWDRISRSSAALVLIRDIGSASSDGAANLTLLDLSLHLERELNRAAFEISVFGMASILPSGVTTRVERMVISSTLP